MDEHIPESLASAVKSLPFTVRAGVTSERWRALLHTSNADSLFLDWAWQKLWWETYAQDFHAPQLATVLLEDGNAQATCIANLYFQQVQRLPLVSFRSLQFVGGAWRNADTMLTEYLEPIVAAGPQSTVFQALLEEIATAEWDEFVIELTPVEGAFAQAIRAWSDANGWYLREMDHSEAYHVALHDGFAAYTRSLSGNARRRLLNNRGRLSRHGQVEIKQHRGSAVMTGLQLLNTLHARRWQEPAFDERRLAFLESLHSRFGPDTEPLVSVIEIDGTPISALYDIRTKQRQYNIQMGFDPSFDKSISLGLLHLGYAMEEAASAAVKCYDMLGGTGQRTNYKEPISTGRVPLVTLQVVRNTRGKVFYKLRDSLRRSGHPILLTDVAQYLDTIEVVM